MPGAELVPGRNAQLRGARARRGDDRVPTRWRSSRTARPARRSSSRGRELADAVARCRAGSACGSGVQRGRPRRRVPPEHPRDDSSRSSPPRAWARCGRRARRSSATRSVVDRFAQIEPTVLLAVDGYRYGDKVIDKRAEVAAIEAALPTLRHTVHVSYLGDRRPTTGPRCSPRPGPLEFDPVPFDHPLYVLYSSGTTGLPEGDRARARRHHRRAPEDDCAAPRPRRG